MKNKLTAFKDITNNKYYLYLSNVKTNKYIYINKIKYPLYKIDISSSSHPFYTKKIKFADTIKKIEKFKKKYKNFDYKL
ncbi:MAG: 50S ribosomal protein L31 [Candidatus Shikimatogenerans sp. Tcar]|uniref:50S ribosomal protein L31 n=1 Tax=Candidatus Shikimatogenerans sp. Tcar TaxID=3158565 RepID=A0AAU7QUX1_9FLAO